MTSLRGKHKQIYNLVVKEVDPQVNWAALVDEKLVRPRLQPCAGRTPPFHGYHGPALRRVTSPTFLSGCVSADGKAQRGVAPSSVSPSRCVGDWDPPGIPLQVGVPGRLGGAARFLAGCLGQQSSLSDVTWASNCPDQASISPSVKWK